MPPILVCTRSPLTLTATASRGCASTQIRFGALLAQNALQLMIGNTGGEGVHALSVITPGAGLVDRFEHSSDQSEDV